MECPEFWTFHIFDISVGNFGKYPSICFFSNTMVTPGWRPFSQLSFAQPRGACPWGRVVTSALFPSALGGQCGVLSAVPSGALTPQCGVSSALSLVQYIGSAPKEIQINVQLRTKQTSLFCQIQADSSKFEEQKLIVLIIVALLISFIK